MSSARGRVLLFAREPGSHLTCGENTPARRQEELPPKGELGVGVVVGDGSRLGDEATQASAVGEVELA